jgi:hypothetical protein
MIIHVARVQTLTPEYTKFGLRSGIHRYQGNEVGLGIYSSPGILDDATRDLVDVVFTFPKRHMRHRQLLVNKGQD